MGVNLRGTFLCYKYAGLQMIAQGRGGRIIGKCRPFPYLSCITHYLPTHENPMQARALAWASRDIHHRAPILQANSASER